MKLFKDNQISQDTWTEIGDDPLPAVGDLLVSYSRLSAEHATLTQLPVRLGVIFDNAERAEVLKDHLQSLSLIVLAFPSFGDGRAYSLARQLRDLGYTGELRARGDVLPDQLQFMMQVGFDTFEVSDRFTEQDWRRAAEQISLSYQPITGNKQDIWQARHAYAEALREQPHAG